MMTFYYNPAVLSLFVYPRFRNVLELDEAEVLAGRFMSVSARHYVLNDPEKLSSKYIAAWANFGLDLSKVIIQQ